MRPFAIGRTRLARHEDRRDDEHGEHGQHQSEQTESCLCDAWLSYVLLADRDVMMNTVAPVWDGNETWLVLGGGGLMAAFPWPMRC